MKVLAACSRMRGQLVGRVEVWGKGGVNLEARNQQTSCQETTWIIYMHVRQSLYAVSAAARISSANQGNGAVWNTVLRVCSPATMLNDGQIIVAAINDCEVRAAFSFLLFDWNVICRDFVIISWQTSVWHFVLKCFSWDEGWIPILILKERHLCLSDKSQ